MNTFILSSIIIILSCIVLFCVISKPTKSLIDRVWHPAYGSCGRCGMTWATVEGHITYYSPYSGCFPLCEKCWPELTPIERWPYYKKLIGCWKSGGSKDHNGLSWDQLEENLKENVMKGL